MYVPAPYLLLVVDTLGMLTEPQVSVYLRHEKYEWHCTSVFVNKQLNRNPYRLA